ncbi:MAG: NUDIX domain-containing protein [Kofleriaceae bacterium]
MAEREMLDHIERALHPGRSYALPGGFVEEGEWVADAAVREAKEETGLDVELVELFHVYRSQPRPRQDTISTVFIGGARGTPVGGDDAERCIVCVPDELPAARARPPDDRRRLQAARRTFVTSPMKTFALLVLAACRAPAAHAPAPAAGPPAITLCHTTEAELRAALGEPTRDGIFHDARIESWILGEGHGGVVRYLAVMLDPKGVVIDRVWNVPTEIPWVPADQCNVR